VEHQSSDSRELGDELSVLPRWIEGLVSAGLTVDGVAGSIVRQYGAIEYCADIKVFISDSGFDVLVELEVDELRGERLRSDSVPRGDVIVEQSIGEIDIDGETVQIPVLVGRTSSVAEQDLSSRVFGILGLFEQLERRGVVSIGNALWDPVVEAVRGEIGSSETLIVQRKEEYRSLIERAKMQGDSYMGSAFAYLLGAALMTHEVNRSDAAELIIDAWSVLGEPYDDTPAGVHFSRALLVTGDHGAAERAFDRTVESAETLGHQLYARGSKAELMHRCGNSALAVATLELVLTEDEKFGFVVEPIARQVFLENLEGFRNVATDSSADPGEEALARLTQLIQSAQSAEDLAKMSAEMDSLISELERDEHLVRPMVAVTFLVIRGQVERQRGNLDASEATFARARLLAETVGDPYLSRMVQFSQQHGAGANPHRWEGHDSPWETDEEELMVRANRAQQHILQGASPEGALLDLELAVAAAERYRSSFLNAGDRSRVWVLGQRACSMLAAVTSVLGRHRDCFDSLERLRAQGLPDSWDPVDALTTNRDLTGLNELGYLPVSLTRRVVAIADSTVGSNTIAVDEAATLIAGEPAWWMSCALAGPVLVTATRSPDGVLSSQSTFDASEVERLVQQLVHIPASHSELATSPLFGNADSSLEPLLEELSRQLISPELRKAALRAVAVNRPLRLIVAAISPLSRVPWGLLPIGQVEGRLVTLLDSAIIQLSPTPGLLWLDRPERVSPSQEIRDLFVLGRGSEFQGASALVDWFASRCDTMLVPEGHFPGAPDARVADCIAVIDAVASHSGLMLYYGHVDAAPIDKPLNASLRLVGAALQASQFLGPRRGSPRIAIVAGCSSLGSNIRASGESWGLATALGWQGTECVIGSLWDPLHDQYLMRFITELHEAVRDSGDPFAQLRAVQLRWRDQWQASRPHPSVFPGIWAGWASIGWMPLTTTAS
jgi:CHAT domain